MRHYDGASRAEISLNATFPRQCGEYRSSFRLTEVRGGFLNQCHIFEHVPSHKVWVVRSPKPERERSEARTLIQNDFERSGALAAGLSFHLRSVPEQAAFINRCVERGLSVVPNFSQDERYLVLPYVQGTPLTTFVAEPDLRSRLESVYAVFQHLRLAHERGIVFGDRWGPNTFIGGCGRPREFDFDVEIVGPHDVAQAFEVAQAQYHLVHFAQSNRVCLRDYMATKINPDLVKDKKQTQLVREFTLGFTSLYREMFEANGALLEGIEPPSTDELRGLLP